MRFAEHIASIQDMRYSYAQKMLIVKPEARRSFGRYRLRWENYNKINMKEIS
jgi:hypothetical protein